MNGLSSTNLLSKNKELRLFFQFLDRTHGVFTQLDFMFLKLRIILLLYSVLVSSSMEGGFHKKHAC